MHNSRLQDGQTYTILDAMLHPKFINHSIYDDYDLALITLQRKIVFGFKVKPICLPLPGDDFSGQSAIVAGWGGLQEGVSSPGVELQEIRIKILNHNACTEGLKAFADYNEESMICGFENKKDACQVSRRISLKKLNH